LSSGYLGLGQCYYGVDLFLRMDGYPCYGSYDAYNDNFVCTNYDSVGEAGEFQEGGTVTEDFYPGTVSESGDGIQSQFISGGYVYIGVKRGYPSDYNNTCSYTILVQADYCGNGTNVIASSTDYDEAADTYCTTYQNVLANNTTPFVSSFTNATALIYKYIAPSNLGSLNITVNATSYFEVYGTTYQSYQSSAYADCYDSSSSVGDFYILSIQCSAIYAGDFFINLVANTEDGDNSFNGTITITPTICYTGVGPNCNSPVIDLTNLTTQGFVRIPRLVDEQYAYGYLPLTSDLVGPYSSISLGVQSTNFTYIYVGRNRYATNDNNDEFYEESSTTIADATFIALSTNDAQLYNGQAPGIYWVSIQCYEGDSCSDIILFGNFSSSNPIASSTTNHGVTSGMMMNMTMTSGKAAVATSGKMTTGVRATTGAANVMTTSPRTTGLAAASSNAVVVVASIVLSLIAVIFAF